MQSHLFRQPSYQERDIKESHRRVMIQNHPDNGGSQYLALKINEAKKVLMTVVSDSAPLLSKKKDTEKKEIHPDDEAQDYRDNPLTMDEALYGDPTELKKKFLRFQQLRDESH
eukprot:TRINITY_DN7160_c0_g1_i3.p1 TRINITY_DN7160_c0_g1~~TRINITY_DN7160_c0_g1_i3.p1  ORF type:complete len:113 (-),score=32.27 TRINITY_DN7160_c0_g1_i3:137-475(-)